MHRKENNRTDKKRKRSKVDSKANTERKTLMKNWFLTKAFVTFSIARQKLLSNNILKN